jgi:hypothetical protein
MEAESSAGGESSATLATVDEPSPPRPPLTGSESLRLVGGLVVVCAGLFVLLVIAVIAVLLVKKTTSDVVSIATSAFGVIGTVIGAYFGVKIGADGTQTAIAGLKDEAAKAQAFAVHVPTDQAESALAHAQALASAGRSLASEPRNVRPQPQGPGRPRT